jgi:hypothetical protein
LLSLEMSGLSSNPDAVVRRFDRVIGSLPPAARRLWTRARDRVFDVGVETTTGKAPFVVTLGPDTVKTVARLQARIAITVYPRLRGRIAQR